MWCQLIGAMGILFSSARFSKEGADIAQTARCVCNALFALRLWYVPGHWSIESVSGRIFARSVHGGYDERAISWTAL